jgi:hypothetical protein
VRPLRQAGLLVALAAVAACARCGGAEGPPPERHVPADVVAAVVVPELRGAARSLGAFYATARDFPGTSDLPGLRASLSAQLGFDPLDTAALRDAGIDPRGGMAIAWPAPSRGGAARPTAPLLVLPISNGATAEAFVQRLAVERLGAGVRAVEVVGPAQVTVYRERAGAPAALAMASAEGSFVLCPGPHGPEAVSRAVSLAPGDALAESGAWQVARRAAGKDAAAIAFAPAGSPALSGLWALRDGVALALSAEPRKLHARVVMLLGGREAGFVALSASGAGGGLTAGLDPSAALVGRWDGAPGALAEKLLPLLPAAERARLQKAGVDPGRDLFDAVAPGAVASFSLAHRIQLSTLDAGSLRRDPLRLIQFELVLPLRDPARVAALSERVARLGGQRQRGPPWSVPTASGEVAWAIDGDRLIATGGAPGRLSALRARLAGGSGGYRAPTDDARRVLASGGLGAVVFDTRNAAASVRALPPEAFGTGPTGFVMRSLVERFVEPAERIEAASLRATVEPGALVLALEVQPAPPEDRQP